jgi:DNA-binding NtrC family response regulator
MSALFADDSTKIGGFMDQSVVVLEKDPRVARSLAGGLRPHFAVQLINTREELRDRLATNHPEALVLNIEYWRLTDVKSLHQDFPELPIVCTHRIPDEEMWMAAMEAGASDTCQVDDVGNVLTSVLRSLALSRSAAA